MRLTFVGKQWFGGAGGANCCTLLQCEQQVSVLAVVSHVRAKASTSLFLCLINETVSSFHRCPQSSLPPGWPFNIRSKRGLSRYRHVSTRWGRFKVNSREVDVMRRDNSALIIRFINVSINR